MFSAIPFQFFTERRTAGVFGAAIGIAVADANQTVGDITGRLDFDVAVADGIAAFVITCAPSKVFGAFTAFAADVVINTAARGSQPSSVAQFSKALSWVLHQIRSAPNFFSYSAL